MNATIRFTTRWPYNIGSLLVARLAGAKLLSHCMLIVDGIAYQATMERGCTADPVGVAMEGIKQYQDMPVEVPNLWAATQWGSDQRGKGYDWAGAFGIPFLASDDWADDSRWWCSEFVFAMLMAGGLTLLDPDEKKRVTPNDLHILPFPKTALVQC